MRNRNHSYDVPPTPPDDVVDDIIRLVNRSYHFLSTKNIKETGFIVDAGAGTLVHAGEGDYLGEKELIDLKCSKQKFSSAWNLQILMYYIMGLHSGNPSFKNIEYIGIYNAAYNTYYRFKIADIDDSVFYEVSHRVIGYKMLSEDASDWLNIDLYDVNLDWEERYARYHKTDFDIRNYADGIYPGISLDDYWTFLQNTVYHNYEYAPYRPNFSNVYGVTLIVRDGYAMFIAKTKTGRSIMREGGFSKCTHPDEYYYENLGVYCRKVEQIMKQYSIACDNISSFVSALERTSDNDSTDPWWFTYRGGRSGSVHGSIIDIDGLNHLYLNPIDGTLTPYHASSTVFKYAYANLISLIADKKPALLPTYQKLIGSVNKNILMNSDDKNLPIPRNSVRVLFDGTIYKESTFVPEMTIYKYSNVILNMQKLIEHKYVVQWIDAILSLGSEMFALTEDIDEDLPEDSDESYLRAKNENAENKSEAKPETVLKYTIGSKDSPAEKTAPKKISPDLSKVRIGSEVNHKKFGDGRVIGLDENYILVKFKEGEKKFQFPHAFENGFLNLM